MYHLIKPVFGEQNAVYRVIRDCRKSARKFLKRFSSGDLFETALRHKIKDEIQNCCSNLEDVDQFRKKLNLLRLRLLRLNQLMEGILLGRDNGLLYVLKGIKDDAAIERPTVMIEFDASQSALDCINDRNQETFLAICVIEFVGNALQAIKGNAAIKIRLKKLSSRSAVFLSVWNNGSRVPKAIVKNLFCEGVTTRGEGRGMGLYLIRHLAERLNGHVEFNHENGVRFSVTLNLENGASSKYSHNP